MMITLTNSYNLNDFAILNIISKTWPGSSKAKFSTKGQYEPLDTST